MATDLSRVPPHAASGVEHGPAAKRVGVEIAEVLLEVRRPRRPPVAERGPLVAKAVLRVERQRIIRNRPEARNAIDDGYDATTGRARETGGIVPCRGREAAGAGRTAKESDQIGVQ